VLLWQHVHGYYLRVIAYYWSESSLRIHRELTRHQPIKWKQNEYPCPDQWKMTRITADWNGPIRATISLFTRCLSIGQRDESDPEIPRQLSSSLSVVINNSKLCTVRYTVYPCPIAVIIPGESTAALLFTYRFCIEPALKEKSILQDEKNQRGKLMHSNSSWFPYSDSFACWMTDSTTCDNSVTDD
jgi:hypothetical protein